MQRQTTQIVISGGGIAGLAAAAGFSGAGFDVVIADPVPPVVSEDADGADLRTTAFLQPARSFLDHAGLWDRLAPFAQPLQIMRIVDASGDPPVTCDFDASDLGPEPFGWNLPNWLLRREMTAELATRPNVDFRPGVGFATALARSSGILVGLTDSTQLQAELLIGADGRHSPVRNASGIGVKTTHYGQNALTFAVTHPEPHQNVSTEVHQSGGPFTLVPLPDHDSHPCSAVVWMSMGNAAHDLAALDDAALAKAATARSAGVLGDLTPIGKRLIWPMMSQTADRMIAPRTALVAEAAHVIPPIGAQGLNMSLADLDSLLGLAQTHREALGSATMLDAYQAARHKDVRMRVAGIDALNRASMAGAPILQDLRRKGLSAMHAITPLRNTLMQMGLGAGR